MLPSELSDWRLGYLGLFVCAAVVSRSKCWREGGVGEIGYDVVYVLNPTYLPWISKNGKTRKKRKRELTGRRAATARTNFTNSP